MSSLQCDFENEAALRHKTEYQPCCFNADSDKLPDVLDDMESYSEFDSPRVAENVDMEVISDETGRVMRHDQAPVMGMQRIHNKFICLLTL